MLEPDARRKSGGGGGGIFNSDSSPDINDCDLLASRLERIIAARLLLLGLSGGGGCRGGGVGGVPGDDESDQYDDEDDERESRGESFSFSLIYI